MSHVPRPALASRFPVHVTVRIGDDVPRLRSVKRCKVLRAALLRTCRKSGFRICHFSVQRNHICYVLQNGRKHGESLQTSVPDPFSSAWHFDGWRDDRWRTGLAPPDGLACVAGAKTWLLSKGWRRHGLLAVGEAPRRAG